MITLDLLNQSARVDLPKVDRAILRRAGDKPTLWVKSNVQYSTTLFVQVFHWIDLQTLSQSIVRQADLLLAVIDVDNKEVGSHRPIHCDIAIRTESNRGDE